MSVPEESPEVEVGRLWAADCMCYLRGLIACDPLLVEVEAQSYDYLEEHQDDGPRPDDEVEFV